MNSQNGKLNFGPFLLSLWLLLLFGRGIAGTMLLWAELVSPEALRTFDETGLTLAYDGLLVFSLLYFSLFSRVIQRNQHHAAETEGSALVKRASAREETL